MSKKLIHFLSHVSLLREDDGAIEFWRTKDLLQDHFVFCHHWSDDKWKSRMAGGGGHNKIFQYCTDSSGTILYLRALQGHSGRSPIDPTLQDDVAFPSNFFQYIYHVECAINLHSIINSGFILGGQNLSNKQTVFFLLVDPMDRNRNSCIKHGRDNQNAVHWVDTNLALRKGLKFYQTRSNAIILH